MTNKLIITLVILFLPCYSFAQHDMKSMPGMQQKKVSHDTTKEKEEDDDMDMDDRYMYKKMKVGSMDMMSSGFSRNLPMSRDGSGSAWNPDASPIYAYMTHARKWMFMFHGDIFVRYNKQDFTNEGSRGGEKWDAPNMLMLMGQRKIGKKGLFHFNTMFSSDALIAGGSGYPLLYQTGESWNGKPLVDRQHPHDLFSELSVSYSYSLSKKADVFIYAGYPGEPALGPVTFMHRPSGRFAPDAPISHHWVDATHITFGVGTIGFRYGKFKVEGSSFTGREPDENRYNFDKPLFDSWSGRLSFNPSANWALQVSHGFIKKPEILFPNENVNRTTASATYVNSIATGKYFSATALWGQNAINGEDASDAILIEGTIKLKRLAVYSRYEWVNKSGEELDLNILVYNRHTLYSVNAVTLGAAYDIFKIGKITIAGGGQLALNIADKSLKSLYGTNPVSGEIYLHFYPNLSQ